MTDLPLAGQSINENLRGALLVGRTFFGCMPATRSYCPILERGSIPLIICLVVSFWNVWAFLRRFTFFFQAIHRFFSRGKFAFLLRAILFYSAARFFSLYEAAETSYASALSWFWACSFHLDRFGMPRCPPGFFPSVQRW